MHDPLRQLEYLRQCLRQDKLPIGFFLSAGCAVSIRVPSGDGTRTAPLIPDIAGMTTRVRESLEASEDAASFGRLLASFGADHKAPNVEELLSQVRALSVVVGDGQVHDLDAQALSLLDRRISEGVAELASATLPAAETPYRTLAAWAGTLPRTRAVEIFTTNYDLLMEQALEEVRVPYFDGFVGSRRPFFDAASMERGEAPARWVRLWKLHGSVNWRLEEGDIVTRVSGVQQGHPALIHPSHLKYEQSRRMPYLAMIDRLRSFLRTRGAALFVCGYSFNDEHLNEVLIEGLEGNQTAAAFGMLYGELKNYPRAEALATRRSNLSLMALDAAVVGTRAASWGNQNEDSTSPEAEAAGDEGGATGARFDLGDFACFGAMLKDVIGQQAAERGADIA